MIRHITRRPTFAKGEILRLCPKVNDRNYSGSDYQSIRVQVADYDGFMVRGEIIISKHSRWRTGEKINWQAKYLALLEATIS